jgi:hypothetical protein
MMSEPSGSPADVQVSQGLDSLTCSVPSAALDPHGVLYWRRYGPGVRRPRFFEQLCRRLTVAIMPPSSCWDFLCSLLVDELHHSARNTAHSQSCGIHSRP